MPHRPQPHLVTDRAAQFKPGPRFVLLVLLGAALGLLRLLIGGTGQEATGFWDAALVIGIHIYLLGLFPIILSWAFPFAGVPDGEG